MMNLDDVELRRISAVPRFQTLFGNALSWEPQFPSQRNKRKGS